MSFLRSKQLIVICVLGIVLLKNLSVCADEDVLDESTDKSSSDEAVTVESSIDASTSDYQYSGTDEPNSEAPYSSTEPGFESSTTGKPAVLNIVTHLEMVLNASQEYIKLLQHGLIAEKLTTEKVKRLIAIASENGTAIKQTRLVAHEGQLINLQCPAGHSILITYTYYGHLKHKCSAGTAFRTLSTLCNHRTHCRFYASNTYFTDPCPGTQKLFDMYALCAPGSAYRSTTGK